MRAFRIIVGGIVLVVAIFGCLWLVATAFPSHYIALQHKSPAYYSELAAACDSILAKHPTGTNDVIWVSVTDASLPGVVKDLHPLKLQVNPQRVWMLLDSDSRAGIGLEWQPCGDNTNAMKLDIVAESRETVLYSINRRSLPTTGASIGGQ